MRNHSSFHPTAPPALILPVRWMASPLCTLAVAVIIAGVLTTVVPAVGEEASSLFAQQCLTCEGASDAASPTSAPVAAVDPVAATATPVEARVALELDRLLTTYGETVSGLGCWACDRCWVFWPFSRGHKLKDEAAPGSGRSGAHIHGCTSNGSCGDHKECPDGGTMSQIVRTLREATPQVLASAVARHPQLMLNGDRGALQLVGCGGAVVASYPVATLASLQPLPPQQ